MSMITPSSFENECLQTAIQDIENGFKNNCYDNMWYFSVPICRKPLINSVKKILEENGWNVIMKTHRSHRTKLITLNITLPIP